MARKIVKFIMALADCNVNRIDALIRVGLNCHAGINGMLELLDRTNKGLYKPKDYTDEEMLRGVLFLRLGGSRVADLAHRSLGQPGISTIRRSSAVTCVSPCAKTPTQLEIRDNIQEIFKGTNLGGNYGYVLMIDELKLEERPRWDDKTNRILGLCREHTKTTELEFCSIEVAKTILQKILDKKIHWASEASVFSFGILSGERHEYGSRPFVISGTCKREKANPHADLIQNVIEACNKEAKMIGPPMYCVASDGKSCRGSALIILTHKRLLSPSSAIFPLLSDLCLMSLLVGDHNLTADKDYKHVIKRLQNLLLHKMGTLINGVHITPALLRFHLKENKVLQMRLDYLLNPHDRQNVPLCYLLLKEVWSLLDPSPSDTPSFVIARQALQLLGSLFRHIVIPFIQINLSLSDQLAHLSAAAHLATFIYTVNGAQSKALAVLTFWDIVLLVKNACFCVAKTKVGVPDGKIWIILLGTNRLESTFGLVRSMIGTDQNADLLQLSTRLSHAVECLNIFEKKPKWDRGPKSLRLPAIEDGNGDILAKVDHINPSSWKGNVEVATVSLLTSWNRG
ncbi:hypothetical protein B0H34DRAFT_833807 [Crassisporium funariophilum]|nr:hypothetical protein B0H34DRAFT_833807 [Crassisporium funariophilum]